MRIALVEHAPWSQWSTGLDALCSALAAEPGWSVSRTTDTSLLGTDAADAQILCAGSDEAYEAILTTRAAAAGSGSARIVLLGVNLPWAQGTLHHAEGSLPHLLETFHLGGAFTASALLDWQEAPSAFAGPKALMSAMNTNALKAFQSERYCVWFVAPGATLGAFLRAYLPLLVLHTQGGAGALQERAR